MITITMPLWFAVSLTIYLVWDMITKILNEIENKRNRDYRQYIKELIQREEDRRYIKEWKEWKERKGKE